MPHLQQLAKSVFLRQIYIIYNLKNRHSFIFFGNNCNLLQFTQLKYNKKHLSQPLFYTESIEKGYIGLGTPTLYD